MSTLLRLAIASLVTIGVGAKPKAFITVQCTTMFTQDDKTCSDDAVASSCVSEVMCMPGTTGQSSQQIVCDGDMKGFTVSDWISDPAHKCQGTPTRTLHVPLNSTCFKTTYGTHARAFCSYVYVGNETEAAFAGKKPLVPFA